MSNEYLDIAMEKVIKQEVNAVLNKIRTEIDRQEKWLSQAGYTAYNVDIAFHSIKLVLGRK